MFTIGLVVLGLFHSFNAGAAFKMGYGGRIIGGMSTYIEDVPYQICVRHTNGNHHCGGAIISRNWAVSAAHCFQGKSVHEFMLVSGSTYPMLRGTIHTIKNIVNHPEYKNNTDFDIGVIEVMEPFKLGSLGVQAVKLASAPPLNGVKATVSGWGYNDQWLVSEQLRKARVPIISTAKCNSFFAVYNITINHRMICAGYKLGGVDACDGDSGGPLVYNGELVGIVSFGIGCALPYLPGVYTRIDGLNKWIENVISTVPSI